MTETIETLKDAATRLRERAATATDKTVNMVMVNGVWVSGRAHYLTVSKDELTTLADWLEHIYYLELDRDSEGTSMGEMMAAMKMAHAVLGTKVSDS